MKVTLWTLAHNLTKLPIIFESGYPQPATYDINLRNLGKAYTYKTRDEAIQGLATYERTHPNEPMRAGIMQFTIDIPAEVELIDRSIIVKAQIETALKRLDKKDADLIRASLK